MIASSEKSMSPLEKRVIADVVNPVFQKCLKYGRLTWVKSLCTPGFTPEKAMELSEEGLRRKLEDTLNLYPFLTLLVEKMKIVLGREFEIWSSDVVNANWLGNKELLDVRISASELNFKITNDRPDIRSARFIKHTKLLEGFSIVTQHSGVVAMEVARLWIDSKAKIRSKTEGYVLDIYEMVSNLNRCSVRTVEVSLQDGEYYFTSTRYYFDNKDSTFKLSEETTKFSEEVADTFIEDWDRKVGIYTIHKYLVVEEITPDQKNLLEQYRDIQLAILNDFIKKP